MVGQLNDRPASRALVLFKDNQQQASIASGVGVMAQAAWSGMGCCQGSLGVPSLRGTARI